MSVLLPKSPFLLRVRDRLANALQTYNSLPAHYAPHGWTSLEAFMLTRALDLHAEAQKPQDKDWILVLLEFLKAYVQDLGKALLITKEDHQAYTSSLVNALGDSARSLKSSRITARQSLRVAPDS